MTKKIIAPILLVAAVLAIASCGANTSGTDGNQQEQVTTVKVGVIPIADVAPLYLGIEKGFFTDESLEVEPQIAQGGAAIVAATVSGDNQFGFSAVPPLLIAKSKDVPIRLAANGVNVPEGPKDNVALVVKPDSDITTAKDLEGEVIAVNALQALDELTVRASLKEAGVDLSAVDFIEVPFPDMIGTLESGRVAAIAVAEPFLSAAQAQGMKALLYPHQVMGEGATLSAYFTSENFIRDNEKAVERFQTAMEKSLDYASDHPEEVREVLPSYTKIPADQAQEIVLPAWTPEIKESSVEKFANLLTEFGLTSTPPSTEGFIYK